MKNLTKATILSILTIALFLIGCDSKQKASSDSAALAGLVMQSAEKSQTSTSTAQVNGSLQSTIQETFNALNDGSFTFNDNVIITSTDGTKIDGNVFVPASTVSGQKFPAVVFINSWALNEYEYLVPAAKLAKKGYVVLSYSTRGFGNSEGLINVAGPKDNEDLTKVLDYLEANYPVQKGNIGLAGISYGAGGSLLGLAKQDRVKTAAALSGWADLGAALYGNGSTRLVWGTILVGSGYLMGRMDPIILEQFNKLLTYTDIPNVLAWADERSAKSFIANINSAGKPVYISNNFSDELFQPNAMLNFFTQLKVPKKMDLNQGIHASGELTGLIGLDNYVWNNVYRWFDYHLKGIDNGIMGEPQVSMEKKLSTGRDNFATWPSSDVTNIELYTHPRSLFTKGALKTSPYNGSTSNRITSGVDTLATAGIPVLSPILESHTDTPVYCSVDLISTINGIVYKSESYSQGLKIRGIPNVELNISLTGSRGMMNVYLYDVSPLGVGKLITHGTISFYEKTPGQQFKASLGLVATAYDLPAGNKLAIAVDTYDPQYSVPTLNLYSVDFYYSSASPSKVSIPVSNK